MPLFLASALVIAVPASVVTSNAVEPAGPTIDTQAKKPRPNFVIIQTDDMTVEDLEYLPYVQKALIDRGAQFTQTLTPFALCCPSRASMMTGSYPHNTKVNANFPPDGGFVAWEKVNGEAFTAYWLQQAGYHTAHIGKYINGYGMYNRPVARTPSGWSEWFGSADPSTYQMYGYRLNEPKGSTVYGDFYVEDAKTYGTDVYTRKAVGVIKRAKKTRGPFMLQVAYLAPHVETIPLTDGSWQESWADVDKPEKGSGISVQSIPPRPALRHQDLLPDMPLTKDPSFNEEDRSDKHPFIRDIPPLTEEKITELTEDNRSRRLSLFAVDEGVKRIVATLRRTGQLENTYIVFMGDNGYLLGQHAISYGKYFPYEPALRIPMVMRGPGIEAGQSIGRMTSEIDVAPTILELAGVTPTRPVDGYSLVGRLLDGERLPTRTILLSSGPQKSASGADLPMFDGVRTRDYSWWAYEDGFEEMYDLRRDPYQLQSVADDPAYAQTRAALRAEWEALSGCVGADCRTTTRPIPGPTP